MNTTKTVVNPIAHTAKQSVVMACGCSHEFQDKKHGQGKRVHNPCAKGYRCTVCGGLKEAKV